MNNCQNHRKSIFLREMQIKFLFVFIINHTYSYISDFILKGKLGQIYIFILDKNIPNYSLKILL